MIADDVVGVVDPQDNTAYDMKQGVGKREYRDFQRNEFSLHEVEAASCSVQQESDAGGSNRQEYGEREVASPRQTMRL
jgi:hypothetical protein